MSTNRVSIPSNNVEYLSMEGGGGKGAVYLGALAALADLEIIQPVFPGLKDYGVIQMMGYPASQTKPRIKGISGASAGAITAALLASGHTINELFNFMTSGVLDEFYDKATPRMVPDVVPIPSNMTGCKSSQRTNTRLKFLSKLVILPGWRDIISSVLGSLSQHWLPTSLNNALKQNTFDYIINLIQDFGLFSGCEARNTLDDMISRKARQQQSSSGLSRTETKNMTFKTFMEIFSVDLIVTGTNITTKESVYFSANNTPTFRVADAVRISMSFPGAFKPVIIPENSSIQGVSPGVWLDGGVLNNNPMHAFDDPLTGLVQQNLLGLRIGLDQPNTSNNIFEFLLSLISTILAASENMQIRTPYERSRTIQISERKLSVLEFKPSPDVLIDAIRSAASTVLQAFGRSSGPILKDIISKWENQLQI